MTKRILGSMFAVALLAGPAFADSHTEKKDTKPKKEEPAAAKCRALDPKDTKNVMAEAEDKSSVKCSGALMDALRAKLCTKENKGKKFEYIVNSDHMIGKTKIKDRNTSLTCHTVKAP